MCWQKSGKTHYLDIEGYHAEVRPYDSGYRAVIHDTNGGRIDHYYLNADMQSIKTSVRQYIMTELLHPQSRG